ncbi:hypothetical protein AB8A21_38980, partial [Streptomyces sp. BF23-18]
MTDASAGADRPAPYGTRPRPAPPGRRWWRASQLTRGRPAPGGARWRLAPRSIRWRLTLLYSALFMAAGAALLGFTYLLASRTAPSTGGGG